MQQRKRLCGREIWSPWNNEQHFSVKQLKQQVDFVQKKIPCEKDCFLAGRTEKLFKNLLNRNMNEKITGLATAISVWGSFERLIMKRNYGKNNRCPYGYPFAELHHADFMRNVSLLDRHLTHKTQLLISVKGDGQVLARISKDGKRIEQIAEP